MEPRGDRERLLPELPESVVSVRAREEEYVRKWRRQMEHLGGDPVLEESEKDEENDQGVCERKRRREKRRFYELVSTVTGLMEAQMGIWKRMKELEGEKWKRMELETIGEERNRTVHEELRGIKDELICARIRMTELEGRLLSREEKERERRKKQRSDAGDLVRVLERYAVGEEEEEEE